jgi:hypothetical protein
MHVCYWRKRSSGTPVSPGSGRALTGQKGMDTFSVILVIATAIGLTAFLVLLER